MSFLLAVLLMTVLALFHPLSDGPSRATTLAGRPLGSRFAPPLRPPLGRQFGALPLSQVGIKKRVRPLHGPPRVQYKAPPIARQARLVFPACVVRLKKAVSKVDGVWYQAILTYEAQPRVPFQVPDKQCLEKVPPLK